MPNKKRGVWMFNKRASLEISIQAIVIVVLAMTLLGLGLVFIKNQFTGLGSIQEEVQEQVKQKILDDLISGDKKVSFPRTDITIDKGGALVMTIGIRNKKDNPLHYKMRFTPIQGPDGAPFSVDNPSWFQFAQTQVYTLSAAESDVRNIRLSIPTRIPSGSYFLTFDIIDDDLPPPGNVYAQKDFFINVRG
ncbi:hypothetical protein HYV80_03145 [Candidatus Woesearchaeota archaeon]|nr:hypothetical protein [Candidatus Woesearchaeota archaeon]